MITATFQVVLETIKRNPGCMSPNRFTPLALHKERHLGEINEAIQLAQEQDYSRKITT